MADVIAAHPWGRPELIETCGEILLILATPAGRMVVDAASAGGRKMTERGYVQLMGHGNPEQTQLAEQ